MGFAKLILAVFLVGCGVDASRPYSLTDTKSVLLYQHVDADKFRLLACPYSVDLNIGRDCRNVFLTADGGEYYFTGVPKQPWAFAPTHARVKKVLTIPIIVGGAVLSWWLLRKLRAKQVLQTVQKETDELFAALDSQASRKLEQVTAGRLSQQQLLNELADLTAEYRHTVKLRYDGSLGKAASASVKGDRVSGATVAELLAREKAFMDEQFSVLQRALGELGDAAASKKQGLLKRIFSRSDGHTAEGIFASYKSIYDDAAQGEIQAFADSGKVFTAKEAARTLVGRWSANDETIDVFLRKFGALIEDHGVYAQISAARASFRAETLAAVKEDLVKLATPADMPAAGLKDYLLTGAGGLLAGAYLPDRTPNVATHMFTKLEWQKLFVRDDTFKNPWRVADIYAVVKKVQRHLQRRGDKVAINEKVFFGLKN